MGLVGVELGAGRTRSDQAIDPLVGIRIDAPVGTFVQTGEPVMTVLHGSKGAPPEHIESRLSKAVTIREEPPEAAPLIIERIG